MQRVVVREPFSRSLIINIKKCLNSIKLATNRLIEDEIGLPLTIFNNKYFHFQHCIIFDAHGRRSTKLHFFKLTKKLTPELASTETLLH